MFNVQYLYLNKRLSKDKAVQFLVSICTLAVDLTVMQGGAPPKILPRASNSLGPGLHVLPHFSPHFC